MHTRNAIQGALPHGVQPEAYHSQIEPAIQPTGGGGQGSIEHAQAGAMPSRTEAELTPDQRAWVADYERAEGDLEGDVFKAEVPQRSGFGVHLAKAALLFAVNRCLLPWAVVDAAFARWPALRSA